MNSGDKNHFYKVHPWKVIEVGFDPSRQRASESIFSIGNGFMGQRANFEESYSGDSLQGSYIGGIYYPDKTKVGWWKNGYPEHFAKIINSINWIGIDIWVNGEMLDLSACEVEDFRRTLDMKQGLLKRCFTAQLPGGNRVQVETVRFLSMAQPEAGAISYAVRALNFDGSVTITPYLNGKVTNEDSNYDELFWEEVAQTSIEEGGYVQNKTQKTNFHVGAGMKCRFQKNGADIQPEAQTDTQSQYISQSYQIDIQEGDRVEVQKFAVIASSFRHERKRLREHVLCKLQAVKKQGIKSLKNEQTDYWKEKWHTCDIKIEGDEADQQGIRFNIFQLYQTYTGADERLNIGPKGFTGEKYGGVTYWDTEGYCLPFYLCTAGQEVARNLLLYRYKHLPKAIENARKLGFTGGAALYPMVTMNGEECHNEWEITFEEIHRNGIIAYAIYNYIRHTGDRHYLQEAGLEVLIGIARFWSQRFNFSEEKKKYVMLGVTGPNEYENNVHNNWYTSYIAVWSMRYATECIGEVQRDAPKAFQRIQEKTDFKSSEIENWKTIIDNVYLPHDEEHSIFLQQDGYLDKEQRLADDLTPEIRPLNQHWSWDRILRSCFIKQGDVIQGLYVLEHEFDEETIRRNYDFYEPRTVHESSLSPCIHSILASKLGYRNKAYKLYLRTARLDLDDYNKEVHQGLHITSMAGTWMTIVEGFAGKRVEDGRLSFSPTLPEKWQSYSFKILYRERLLSISVETDKVSIKCEKGDDIDCYIYGKKYLISTDKAVTVETKKLEK